MNAVVPVEEEDWAAELSWRQEQFVLEYVANGFKGLSRAATAAGYANHHSGSQLMRTPKVVAAIEHHKVLFYKSKQLARERILYELANIAGFDMGEIMRVDANGDPHIDLSMATTEHTRVLKEIETTTERLTEGKGKDAKDIGTLTKVKVKTHDKLAALRLLMQHLGMIQEGAVNLQVNLDFGDRMSTRRAKIIDQEP